MQIAQSSGNVFIQSMMGCLNEYVRKYTQVVAQVPINRHTSILAHEEIFECIKNKNTGEAGIVTRKHLSRMLEVMEKLESEQKLADSRGELKNVLDLLRQRQDRM
jgi:DNA-binding FadR family transcriptional regulator